MRAPGRRERSRLETRRKIIAAAMQLFGERGFAETRVEDITERADVAKGTFFNYFPSKEAIFAGFGETQRAKVAAAWNEYRDGKEHVTAVLARMVRQLTAETSANARMTQGILSVVCSNMDIQKALTRHLALGRRTLTQMLKLAQERGEIRRDIAAARMAATLQQLNFGTTLLWTINPGTTLESWLAPAFRIFCEGVKS